MATDSKGLLFVYAEEGTAVDPDAFRDWYNNEHVPARIKLADVHSATRYRASDSQSPSWLAIYDFKDPGVIHSPEYVELFKSASETERRILAEVELLQRRVYSLTSVWTPERLGQSSEEPGTETPAKYLMVAGVNVLDGEEHEKEYDNFYEQEHMEMIAKIPGWVGGRRYTLVESANMGRNSTGQAPIVMKFLSIHEFNLPGFMESEELKAARATAWATKLGRIVKDVEMRSFDMYKNFSKA